MAFLKKTSGHRSVKALQCYEHTSSAQQQAVTASVNMVDQDTKVGVVDLDSKVSVVTEKPQGSSMVPGSKSPKTAPSFSGNFTNCTINFSLS